MPLFTSCREGRFSEIPGNKGFSKTRPLGPNALPIFPRGGPRRLPDPRDRLYDNVGDKSPRQKKRNGERRGGVLTTMDEGGLDPLVLVAGGLFMGAFGFLILSGGVFSLYLYWDARRWPKTQATILTARVVETWDDPDAQERLRVKVPSITFAYRAADGQQYEGWTNVDNYKSGSSRPARKWVQSHPPGTQITVHYNPKEPSEFTLPEYLVTWPFISGGLILLGLFMLAVCVWMVIAGILG